MSKPKKGGLWNWYKKQLPGWPDYVIKEFAFIKIKNNQEMQIEKSWLESIKKDYSNVKWEFKKKLKLSLEDFDEDTKQRISQAEGGKVNYENKPFDFGRHQLQFDLCHKRGISKEPLILLKTPYGYKLVEGWHRTIQYLNILPNGFITSAWVASQ